MKLPPVKVLVATGPPGRREEGWNWCEAGELVWVLGGKCCNSPTCGCGISFTGLRSFKTTTHAKIVRISNEQFHCAITEFVERARSSKLWTKKTLAKLPPFIEEMPLYLDKFRASSVLCVEKLGDSREFQLIAQHRRR